MSQPSHFCTGTGAYRDFERFKALLLYIYTNEIEFTRLGFEAEDEMPEADTPRASPKSIYRLADKVNSSLYLG